MPQDLQDKRIILTGASGGIGKALALTLAAQGAKLGLVARNTALLESLVTQVKQSGGHAIAITTDITRPEQHADILDSMRAHFGGTDILINNAGIMQFTDFSEQSPESIMSIINTNITAPMLLTHAVLAGMKEQGTGHIVNIGSIFGSIGFAYYAAYSASKFALRGFSEALRRELAETDINVTYVAPRAVRTPLNSEAVYEMADKVKMKFDEPIFVATKIVDAIVNKNQDVYIGFPESFFVRLNAILPRQVDAALRKQNIVMQNYARKLGN